MVEGEAVIRFRHIEAHEVHRVPRVAARTSASSTFRRATRTRSRTWRTAKWSVLFWASEVFDPERPDTYCSRRCCDE